MVFRNSHLSFVERVLQCRGSAAEKGGIISASGCFGEACSRASVAWALGSVQASVEVQKPSPGSTCHRMKLPGGRHEVQTRRFWSRKAS